MERTARRWTRSGPVSALVLCLVASVAGLGAPLAAVAQQGSNGQTSNSQNSAAPAEAAGSQSNAGSSQGSNQAPSQTTAQGTGHITPEQAKQLFALVDVLMKFASDETGLPIKSTVKRQLTTR
ncbi:MAG TPA: hypothetical protein VME23_19755, partial [Terracidiphilus sp.]|nr:hypothetical protein [Terracidiphilus sp.]